MCGGRKFFCLFVRHCSIKIKERDRLVSLRSRRIFQMSILDVSLHYFYKTEVEKDLCKNVLKCL